jgi:hypothetical protein
MCTPEIRTIAVPFFSLAIAMAIGKSQQGYSEQQTDVTTVLLFGLVVSFFDLRNKSSGSLRGWQSGIIYFMTMGTIMVTGITKFNTTCQECNYSMRHVN